jgi:hypothetical protein
MRAWVLWGVRQDYISDPEILRPLGAYSTRRECEIYQKAHVKLQLERFDKLDRENQERASRAAIVVGDLREQRGWLHESFCGMLARHDRPPRPEMSHPAAAWASTPGVGSGIAFEPDQGFERLHATHRARSRFVAQV